MWLYWSFQKTPAKERSLARKGINWAAKDRLPLSNDYENHVVRSNSLLFMFAVVCGRHGVIQKSFN
jgi:hypothetical protein